MSRRRLRRKNADKRRRSSWLGSRVEVLESRQLLASFLVSTVADSGLGSLRQAILDANANPNSRILFALPTNGTDPAVIRPLTALPAITAPTIMDGFTQAGTSANASDGSVDNSTLLVRIDGSLITTPGVDGLDIKSANCFISALIITGFTGNGITISGANSQGNFLYANFVGTLPNPSSGRGFSEAAGLGNGGAGISIQSSNNRIGGHNASLTNVFQNNAIGIQLTGPNATGNVLQENFVLRNKLQGVDVASSNNTIGEDQTGGGNIISGNGAQGIRITGGPDAQGNLVVGNLIGTDLGITSGGNPLPAGVYPFPNGSQDILIENSPNNTVGGTIDGARNVIASSPAEGILIDGAASTGNLVQGNYIGFNIAGGLISLIIPNQDGIRITSGHNTVGGSTKDAQNTISVNQLNGIVLDGPGATGNLIVGNFVGLNPDGGSDFGNSLDGIVLDNAPNNTVGGTNTGDRNYISGNNNGIRLTGAGATGNLILGNAIGTKSDATSRLENAMDGVLIDNAPLNTVGGTATGAGNVISGNNRGIEITSSNKSASNPGAHDNLILGNFIGTDATGKVALGNSIDGILITDSSNNIIGGTVAAAGNAIAFNAGNGVLVASGTGNAILSNRIYTNTELGINLGGGGVLTNNPAGDPNGPNEKQPYPVLTAATPNGGATNIQGSFVAAPSTKYTIQFFSSPAQDPTHFGEGASFLGSVTLTTDANGNAPLNVNIPVEVPSGQFITATATDPQNNTSEFSNDIPSQQVSVAFDTNSYSVDQAAGVATIKVVRSGGAGGQVLVSFATGGGTAVAGKDYTPTSGTLTFNPGVTEQIFTIPILNNPAVQPDVSLNITLTNPTGGATLGAVNTATLTIKNHNQLSMQFSASDFSTTENAGIAIITVTRNSTQGTTSVAYETGGGTAVVGKAYNAVSGTLTFGPGETSKTFTIPIIDQFKASGQATVELMLSAPTGGILGPTPTATLTIHNTDAIGSLAFSTPLYLVKAGAGSATIVVNRIGGQAGTVSVAYSATTGTAVAGVGFRPVAGKLSFLPGQTTQSFKVPILDPHTSGSHTVKLTLKDVTGGATLGSISSATLSIQGSGQRPVTGSPSVPGPLVTGLSLQTNAQGVTGIVLNFNEALNATSAQDVGNYGYFFVVAKPGQAEGAPNDFSVTIRSAVYNVAAHQVVLVPQSPLPPNAFFTVNVNPSSSLAAGKGVTDVHGVLVDGANNGGSGTSFARIVGLGNRLSYLDDRGNQVSLQLTGGLMEVVRGPLGSTKSVMLIGTTPGRSVLSGQARLSPSGRQAGVAIPSISGTAGVKIRLSQPPFRVGNLLP